MKAIVVEIDGKNMIVVDSNGCFKKIKYVEGCREGQEIEVQSGSNIRYLPIMQRIAVAAAVFVIAVGLGLYGYYSPYSYVSMDINPSVEIVLNRFEKVLDVQPLNEDGKKIVEDSQRFMHKKVDVVITTLIDKAHEENYLKDSQDNEIFITVSSSKQKVAKKISEEVKEYAAGEMENSDIGGHVTAEGVTIEKRVMAKKESISVGKFLLLEQLQQVSPDADIDEVKNKSVKDIVENIKKQKDKDKDEEKEKEKEKQKEKDKASDKDEINNKQGNIDKKEDTVEVKKQNQVNQNNKKIEEEKNIKQKTDEDNKILPVEQKKQEKKNDTSQQPNVSLPSEKQPSKSDAVDEENAKKENEDKEDSKVRNDLYNKEVEDQSETIGQGKAKDGNEGKNSNKAGSQNDDEDKNEKEDKKERKKKEG